MAVIDSGREAEQGMCPGAEMFVVIDFNERNEMHTFTNSPSLEEWIADRAHRNFVVLRAARVEFTTKTVVTLKG